MKRIASVRWICLPVVRVSKVYIFHRSVVLCILCLVNQQLNREKQEYRKNVNKCARTHTHKVVFRCFLTGTIFSYFLMYSFNVSTRRLKYTSNLQRCLCVNCSCVGFIWSRLLSCGEQHGETTQWNSSDWSAYQQQYPLRFSLKHQQKSLIFHVKSINMWNINTYMWWQNTDKKG